MSDKDKAAPVGEREAFEAWLDTLPDATGAIAMAKDEWDEQQARYFKRESCPDLNSALAAFQAGAAHQRAQQPQSAEAVNRAHVMDALLMWNRRHEVPPIKIGYEYGVAGAVLDLVATPQPSAGVVVPERLRGALALVLKALDRDAADGREVRGEMATELRSALDEFARLNGKEVGRG